MLVVNNFVWLVATWILLALNRRSVLFRSNSTWTERSCSVLSCYLISEIIGTMDEFKENMSDTVLEYSDEEDFYEDGCAYYSYLQDSPNLRAVKPFSISQPAVSQPNQQEVKSNSSQTYRILQHKHMHKICVDKYQCPQLPESASNLVDASCKRIDEMEMRSEDEKELGTVEEVLGKRATMILLQLVERGDISEIKGYISKGEVANVYYASTASSGDRALKIYKTSTVGKNGHCKTSDIKTLTYWAENERRNLQNIHSHGLPCPKPLSQRSNVLVMSFIGKDGWNAPLLKDVILSESKARKLYLDCVKMMWSLYHKCKLIHADLSEYNLLYNDGQLVVIDVSQSVEPEHPHAMEFLRKDCTNITEYFKKCGVPVMTVKELFDFITDININDDNLEDYLAKAQEIASNRDWDNISEEAKIDEEVFKQSYIPKKLNEVINAENDIFSEDREILYHSVTGLKPSLTAARPPAEDSDARAESDSCSDDGKDQEKTNNGRPRVESPNSKKERKKALKEARRLKQQTKMAKHEKKRLVKLGRRN